jgi:hypothetical protein
MSGSAPRTEVQADVAGLLHRRNGTIRCSCQHVSFNFMDGWARILNQ